jgi:adenylate kinase family enzyme
VGRGRALNRVVVGGISGAGKTTLAAALAARLGLRHVEIDALFHGPGWEPRPTFVADVDEATRGDGWLADGFGYSRVADLLWSRCDTFVWVDYSRPVVMVRVLRRSLARATLARELWNGNREGFVDWLDPEHPIRWAWTQHRSRRACIEARIADPRSAGVRVVHLPNPAATRRWLRGLESVR